MEMSAGKYMCDFELQIIKTLDTNVVKSEDGKRVEKIYGCWATDPDNFIHFTPGTPVELSKEVVNMSHVSQLIQRGILKRVF